MKKMTCSELVFDFDLYPRNSVDSQNVTVIAETMAAGTELPPIIIDKTSKRIIDGFHRVRACVRLYGEDAAITVIEKSYPSEREMFLDAMQLNASHGAKLDSCDRMHCLIISERLKLPMEVTAEALHMTVDRITRMKNSRMARDVNGQSLPLKNTVRNFHGKVLTKRQIQANRKLSGMNQIFYVNQLIELIEAKMLDETDEVLLARIAILSELLDHLLAD